MKMGAQLRYSFDGAEDAIDFEKDMLPAGVRVRDLTREQREDLVFVRIYGRVERICALRGHPEIQSGCVCQCRMIARMLGAWNL